MIICKVRPENKTEAAALLSAIPVLETEYYRDLTDDAPFEFDSQSDFMDAADRQANQPKIACVKTSAPLSKEERKRAFFLGEQIERGNVDKFWQMYNRWFA